MMNRSTFNLALIALTATGCGDRQKLESACDQECSAEGVDDYDACFADCSGRELDAEGKLIWIPEDTAIDFDPPEPMPLKV